MSRPPRVLEVIVAKLVPTALRADFLEDLREEYAERRARRGRVAAVLRYVYEILCVRPRQLRRAHRRVAQSVARRGRRTDRGEGETRRGFAMMNGLGQDLRASLRGIRRTRASSAFIVLTVAVAMGSATLVFSVYEGVILRPFPYVEAGSLVDVHLVNPVMMALDDPSSRTMGARFPLSMPVFTRWREAPGLPFAAFGAYGSGGSLMLDGDGDSDLLRVTSVTADVFDVLGVRPFLGRLPTRSEDGVGGPATAVLTHETWRLRFGGDRSVLGREIRLGERSYSVAAVMPADFYFPSRDVDVLTSFSDVQKSTTAGTYFLRGIGRLRPGVDVAAAQDAMESVVARAGTMIGDGPAGVRIVDRREALLGDVDLALHVLMATVLIVLLVACVNVTNLLLARGTVRSADVAVRRALGAGPGRLVRLQLVETLLLVAGGALLGVGAASFALDPALELLPAALPRQDGIAFNGNVAAFALLATLVAAGFATVVPSWFANRSHPEAALRGGGRGIRSSRATGRAQRVLAVVEMTAAVMLLSGAGLLARSYLRLTSVPLGFDPHDVVVVPIYTTPSFARDREASAAWIDQVRTTLSGIAGVDDVVVSADVPFSGGSGFTEIEYETASGGIETTTVANASVTPGYFTFLGVPLLAGRFFEPGEDRRTDAGVVVNQPLANQLWPRGTAVGRRVRLEDGVWREVVGVAAGMVTENPAEPPGARLYAAGVEGGIHYVVVRTFLPANAMAADLRSAALSTRPDLQAPAAFTIEGRLADATAHPRFRTTLLVALALVAALLALLGVYAVVSFAVAQRRQEFGVRMALGANRGSVQRAVVRDGFVLGMAGTVLGLLLAAVGVQLIRSFLFEVEPSDPVALGSVVVSVLSVAALASYLPARRAARIDPAEVLRAEG